MNIWILIITVAILGYFFFYLLSVPTPAILGPLVFIVLFSKYGLNTMRIDNSISVMLQALLGIQIGIMLKKQIFPELKKLLFPCILMIIWALLMTFGLGFVLVKYFDLDYSTAFLSAAPSGISETSLIAVSIGADVGIVSVFQFTRMILTLALLPIIVKINTGKSNDHSFMKRIDNYKQGLVYRLTSILSYSKSIKGLIVNNNDLLSHTITLTIGLIGGIIGVYLNIPAGGMTGSFFAVAIFSLLDFNVRRPPLLIRTIMQMGIGITIGLNIASESLSNYSYLIIPITVFTLIMFGTCLINSKVLIYLNKWDLLSALLASAPAGVTPVTILAFDQTDKALEISLLHMARLVTVKIFILPIIAALNMF